MYICSDVCSVISLYLNKRDQLKARLISELFNEAIINYTPFEIELMKPTDMTKINAVFKKINLRIDYARNFSYNDIIPLVNLTSLNIGHNNITDAGLKFLVNLTSLNIGYNNDITDAGLKFLVNLTTLHLGDNKNITDAGITPLVNLTTLHLGYNTNITNQQKDKLKANRVIVRRW